MSFLAETTLIVSCCPLRCCVAGQMGEELSTVDIGAVINGEVSQSQCKCSLGEIPG